MGTSCILYEKRCLITKPVGSEKARSHQSTPSSNIQVLPLWPLCCVLLNIDRVVSFHYSSIHSCACVLSFLWHIKYTKPGFHSADYRVFSFVFFPVLLFLIADLKYWYIAIRNCITCIVYITLSLLKVSPFDVQLTYWWRVPTFEEHFCVLQNTAKGQGHIT